MKLLFVTHGLSNGGAERVLSLLANHFSNAGNNVTIISVIDQTISYEINADINHYHIKAKKNRVVRIVQRLFYLKKNIKENNYDYIISFATQINEYSILAKILCKNRSKLIVSERNDPYNDPRQKSAKFLRRILYPFADFFVFQTEDAKNYFPNKIQVRSAVIPNPINNRIPKAKFPKDYNNIVTIARLNKQKNLTQLIEVMVKLKKSHKDIQLHIYGDGPERSNLIEQIKKSNATDYIFLEGFRKNIYDIVNEYGIFVLPSIYEGISNAMLEALALGLTCVCTDCPIGGARLCIENKKNGLLVPVNDGDSLYEALDYLLNNKTICEKMGKKSINIRNRFSERNIISLWEEVLNENKLC